MGDEGAPSLTAEEEGICTAMQAASFGKIVSKMLILFEQMRKRSFKPLSDFPMVVYLGGGRQAAFSHTTFFAANLFTAWPSVGC